MGSGKSTVGKALARKIKHPFYDADHEIENRCGVDIPTIFEFEGEAGFREREKRILSELTAIDPVVLATGGGAILKRGSRKLLRDNGYVILLSVTIEEQLRRVSLNKNRPLLHGGDVENKLRKLMEERGALYEKTAHHVVQTDSSRMQTVVNSITTHLAEAGLIKPPARRSASTGSKVRSKREASSRTRSATGGKPSATTRKTQKNAKKKTTSKRARSPSSRNPASEIKNTPTGNSTSQGKNDQKDSRKENSKDKRTESGVRQSSRSRKTSPDNRRQKT